MPHHTPMYIYVSRDRLQHGREESDSQEIQHLEGLQLDVLCLGTARQKVGLLEKKTAINLWL